MTPADIAAWIGAAAWLPQVAKWISAVWARPKLRIVPSSRVYLTYLDSGPTVQLDVSLSTSRREAIIERMDLEITHELGEKRHLVWFSVSEFAAQMTVPTGEVMDFARNQPATALKVSTESLTDRRIQLQDPDFAEETRRLGDSFLGHYRFLRPKHEDSQKAVAALLDSKEVRPAKDHFERGFYWKPGSYSFDIVLKTTSSASPHIQKFKVQLSSEDSERLASNSKLFPQLVEAVVKQAEGIFVKNPLPWIWIQTRITAE